MKAVFQVDHMKEGAEFERVHRRMKEQLRDWNPRRIWLACSGGLDSMLLGHTLHLMREAEPGWDLGLLHVNYRLRSGEADEDAAFVAAWAKDRHIECRQLTLDSSQHPIGLKGVQEWARKVRYEWFESQREAGDVLALAHHADDLAETILMRIARGAHLGQLLAMEERREGHWRPFLSLSRQVLEAEAARQNIPHREDSSNAKLIYSRNKVRHLILAELEEMYPGVRSNLLQLAVEARDFVLFSEEPRESGQLFDASVLEGLSPTVARQKISAYVASKCGELRLSRRLLELMRGALVQGETLQLDLSVSQQAHMRGGILRIQSSERVGSQRWSQYENKLTDSHPRTWLSSGVVFERLP